MAMSAVFPPALVIAFAVIVGKRGAPRFLSSLAEFVTTSARLAADHRAIHALGHRVESLEKRVDAGFELVKKQFKEMDKKMDGRFI